MDFFLLGKGRVGSAVSRHFGYLRRPVYDFNPETTQKDAEGILFLAVPDHSVVELSKRISEKFSNIRVIHFSAAADTENMHLLHPYCSIQKSTDLREVTFTLWTKCPEMFEKVLKDTSMNYVYGGITPSMLYHTSAVISGNFSRFFSVAALELLEKEGFDKKTALALSSQLMESSLKNMEYGIDGMTGPASRGDSGTIKRETEALLLKDSDFADIFTRINELIIKAVRNGTVFGK